MTTNDDFSETELSSYVSASGWPVRVLEFYPDTAKAKLERLEDWATKTQKRLSDAIELAGNTESLQVSKFAFEERLRILDQVIMMLK